jgi:aminoglycoside phosphotransferase (APT) family kinase protein
LTNFNNRAVADAGRAASDPALFHPPGMAFAQDWATLGAHLSSHGFRLDLASPPQQFAGGLGNLNYLVTIDGLEWVLRRPPPGELPPGANDMQREFTILSTLWREFPLAPKAIHFCNDKTVLGAPFLIMEYRPGLVIRGTLPATRDVSEPERARLGMRVVDLLADLHAVDAANVGLGSLGRPQGMLGRMIDGWEKRGQLACGPDTPPGIARVARWLRARVPAEQAPSVLHSDFKLDNIILDPLSLEPCAVIDWDMGTRGDPLVDLATLLSYWTEPGDPEAMHLLAQMPTAQPGFPSRADIIEAYARRTGRSVDSLGFYRVLAMLKLTVVFMQLYAKHVRGETTNEKYRGFGTLSAGLLDFTEAITAGHAQ